MGGWTIVAGAGVHVWDKRKSEFLSIYEGMYYKEVPKIKYLLG